MQITDPLIPSQANGTDQLMGLTPEQVAHQQKKFGKNEIEAAHRNFLLEHLKDIATEPMFILLAVACLIYFFLGELTEAIMMFLAILFVSGIELYQETKSAKALEALRQYTRTKVRVLRDKHWLSLNSEDLVPDDVVSVEEGERIPADGVVLQQNDLMVDESVLTGESFAVEKSVATAANRIFQGTTVAAGKGVFKVTAIGNQTEFGQLGKSIESVESSPTPLQAQIKRFVRQMGIAGGLAFAVTFVLNYWIEPDVWKALLFSLTLAMAILPEEIPVAFSAFMALGAYRMIRFGILAKQPKTVESLGSATVICLDKTGTITENKMSLASVTELSDAGHTLEYALLASEPEPYDAMEKAIEAHFFEISAEQNNTSPLIDPREGCQLIKEYALSGTPPMMTHIWRTADGQNKVSSKGALERILVVTGCTEKQKMEILAKADALAADGYRVLGVASAAFSGEDYPESQEDFPWKIAGLLAFYDPPKANAADTFSQLYAAGIRMMMITGDHPATAQNIARQTGIRDSENTLTGIEIMEMEDAVLQQAVKKVNIFARMFPQAKLRVVNALKANGETVAMSGDGVNDGPALKSAQIGVAMGKKGTDIAKSAASLVLLDDNLNSLATAVLMGRRIYDNLRKAIRYVISIHLPIIMAVLAPLMLGWPYPHILLPLHVIFLELVMDPTAAIAFENEPAEANLMQKPPRPGNAALFSWKELSVSILQGIMIAAGVLVMYQFALRQGQPEEGVRSFVFATMVFSNMFLTLANRSFDYALHRTLFYPNRSIPIILGISLLLLLSVLHIPLLSRLFSLAPLSLAQLSWCLLTGLVSVGWFEAYKVIRNG